MVKITDTTFRDAHQSLAATMMETKDMIPIAEKMNKLGLWSSEMSGGATFHKMILSRDEGGVDEYPWARMTQLYGLMPDTLLQILFRCQNAVGYKHYPDDVIYAFIDESVERGIRVFRLFDALNYIPNFKSSTNRLNWHKENGHPDIIIEGGFSYTTSPVHSTDVFVAFAEELQKKGCDTICSKDMAGLLEAKIADELIRKLIESPGLPVHLHDHDSCRRAEDVYLTGAKIAEETGAEVIIDVSFPPFAGGSAQPSILTMVEKLEAAGYSHGLNTKLLEEIAGYFHSILPNYEQHMKAGGVTPAQIIKSQIPGGMISNLVKQINAVGLSHLLDRALEEEVPRVRAEYGFPPLVTPTSQIIGIQAVMNLVATEIHGLERYYTGGGISKLTKTFLNNLVSGRTIDYFLGRYGQPPGEVDENVRDKVLSLAGKGAIPITDRPANHIPPGLKQATALAESVLGKGKATRADALICALYELDGPEYLKRQMAQGIR